MAFHGTSQVLIANQAAACKLENLSAATDPDNPYEPVFLKTLRDLKDRGISGVIFGNIHLADVREWYETRVRNAGLDHVKPLWGDSSHSLLDEVVYRGSSGIVVSIDLQQDSADLLGRAIDEEFVTEVRDLTDIDPCGERGEYHSFVYDGPTFARPVSVKLSEIRKERNHRLLDLIPVPSIRNKAKTQ